MRKVEDRIYYGQNLKNRKMLFEDVVEEWIDYKKRNVKESTFRQLEVITRLHILPYFGRKKIMTVTRDDIKNWIKKYENLNKNYKKKVEKYSHGAREKYLSVMKSILHYAVYEMLVLEKNPADKLIVTVQDSVALKKKKEDVKYYSLEELNKLWDFMATYKHWRYKEYRLYWMLMYFLSKTGLRISEALALRWTDLNGNMLTVERQTSRDKNNNLKLTSLKNTSSYRTIKLDDDVIKELKKFKAIQDELILGNERFHKNSDGIIFQNCHGNYLTPSTTRESIQKYCLKAGVDYKGTHCFRHTHSVLMLESGVKIEYVSKRLGHKSVKTTADIYSHITKKIEEDELQKFASYTKRKSESAQNRHD